MFTLLVIDDEPNVRYSLENALKSDTLHVVMAPTAKLGIRMVREVKPDVVLLDVRLPDMSGLDAFVHIQEADHQLPVIMMTAFTSTDTAIEAMKRGAFDYLIKPVELKQLRDIVAKAFALREMTLAPADFQEIQQLATATETIVGRSQQMQDVYKSIGRVAATEVSVLILGESGTGKELVARAIHHHSKRCSQPLLAINCAAIPETLLESELFGHERGAFTGADRRRAGKFEQASGGTIFLDEIGDMTGATQAKVLRVLQDQRFERVGSGETIQADARVIAATNQELEQLTAVGKFRRDLLYRLKVYTITLPALRERLDDLPLLIDHFITLYGAEVGKRVRSASTETMDLLRGYPWPGNVRELQGAIKNALVNATGEVITPDCLPDNIRYGVELPAPIAASAGDSLLDVVSLVRRLLQEEEPDVYHKIQSAMDQVVVAEAMRHVDNNQVEAARRLGISRTTLRAKLLGGTKIAACSAVTAVELTGQ